MRLRSFAFLAAAGFTVSTEALAGGTGFGGQGQLAVTDDAPIGGGVIVSSLVAPSPPSSTSPASFEFATLSDNGGSGTAFALAPAVDYFVINSLSLGAEGLIEVLSPAHGNSGSGSTVTVFGIVPRVGYDLPITDTVSFWPKVYFGYVTASSSSNGNSGGGFDASAIGVYAPFMFEPARHFLLGIGPNLSTQLSNNQSVTITTTVNGTTTGTTTQTSPQPKATVVGLQATIGGWFLGD